jgi:serine/threonine-protein kinase
MSLAISAPVREGDLIAGKYRVERVLGVGGMGVVVAARHEQLDQVVAVKFVRPEVVSDSLGIERFLREARAAAKLKSEHVARVLDVGTLDSGAPYMVMEFLEGSTLADVLSTHGQMAVEDSVEWLMQACEAVAEAHAAGIVHRDLKPENLFLAHTVGGTGRVKVLDFGISKSADPLHGANRGLTRTQSMLGSPLYMPPEQMRSSRDVDPRADVWSLGVVLYELLTDRLPFDAETMPELCLKVVQDPFRPIAEARTDVPPALEAVVARCLAKDPKERFANAAEMATALEPMARPESRVLAERARFAVSRTGRGPLVLTPRSAASSPFSNAPPTRATTPSSPATNPTLLASSPPSRASSTPSGVSSTPARASSMPSRSSPPSQTLPSQTSTPRGLGPMGQSETPGPATQSPIAAPSRSSSPWPVLAGLALCGGIAAAVYFAQAGFRGAATSAQGVSAVSGLVPPAVPSEGPSPASALSATSVQVAPLPPEGSATTAAAPGASPSAAASASAPAASTLAAGASSPRRPGAGPAGPLPVPRSSASHQAQAKTTAQDEDIPSLR